MLISALMAAEERLDTRASQASLTYRPLNTLYFFFSYRMEHDDRAGDRVDVEAVLLSDPPRPRIGFIALVKTMRSRRVDRKPLCEARLANEILEYRLCQGRPADVHCGLRSVRERSAGPLPAPWRSPGLLQ